MPSSSPSSTSTRRPGHSSLPPLFGRERQLLGWQGLTVTIPRDWNLASFSGNRQAGNARVDDEDGPRLELRWEQPKKSVDLERSIEVLLSALEKAARKRGEPFERAEGERVVSKSRKRKANLINFGWRGASGGKGEPQDKQHKHTASEALAGCGWGVAWECDVCGRIVVGHVIGRGRERPDKIRNLAEDVLTSMECHGTGGWQTWCVFDLQLDVPEEFEMLRAKLMTGRLEIEWHKPPPPGPFSWTQPVQRLAVHRSSLANVLLQNDTLERWAERSLAYPNKKLRFHSSEEMPIRGHEGVEWQGRPKDMRKVVRNRMLDLVMRRRTPPAQLQVWHCPQSNKIYALESELSQVNSHVSADVLDSLACHPPDGVLKDSS